MGAGELGDWDREERRGNWEGNGNSEIVEGGMGAGELGELGPRGEGIGRGMGTVKLLNGGRFLLVNPWGEWE
ncbi:hypothetical protein Peur_056004 [Populus x canadensis]